MNSHPVREVGHLPDFHPDVCGGILLDSDMGDVPPNAAKHADAFSNDLFEEGPPTSLVSSEAASVEGNPLAPASQIDDDLLDNIIARCFDGDADGFGADEDRLSVNEITFNTVPQEKKLLELNVEQRTETVCGNSQTVTEQVLKEDLDVVLFPNPSPPHHHPGPRNRLADDFRQSLDIKKRAIKKGKRSRAPARPWTDNEHQRFEESLELFGRNWEQCAAYIGTRRAQLVRSHAQKHLIKLWKLGKPLPKKVAESGNGYTLSGKPLLADSASARSYLTKIPCPDVSEQSG